MPPTSPSPAADTPLRRGPYTGPRAPAGRFDARVIAASRSTTGSGTRSFLAPYSPGRALHNATPSTEFVPPVARANAPVALPVELAVTEPVTPRAPLDEELEESIVSLPWITSFMEDLPETALPTASVGHEDHESIPESLSENAVEPPTAPTLYAGTELSAGLESHDAPAIVSPNVVGNASLPVDATALEAVGADDAESEGDVWPLDDAGERMRALTTALDPHTTHHDAAPVTDLPEEEDPRPTPMPMWTDSDFLDVMPVHEASLPTDVGMPSSAIRMSSFPHTPELFRPSDPTNAAMDASATNDPPRISNADATARALESLAWRVRNGDLVIPGFSVDLGDAAALATALAALLGAGS